MQYTLTGDF